MKKKKFERDPFEEYHRSAIKQEIFGMFFAVLVVILIALGFLWALEHFPYKN